MRIHSFLALLLTVASLPAAPVPEVVPWAVPDRQSFQPPDQVHFGGWLGSRIDANWSNRLLQVDTGRLLEGYRKRPGRQSWDGEHAGKWLHAATLAWVYSGDPALRAKLDDTVRELIKCQLADGYLGTYLEKDRWTSWDVWAHKYNLLGLITYIRATGNREPLDACRRMADLLDRIFGDQPGKRDLITAGAHVGMAPTSVLEPMALLYRLTGEARYLAFCRYILRAWEQPNGPHILSTLLSAKRVDKVGNAKAYEMLSCLNGALEYQRTVGDKPEILEACLNAWQDIVDHRLYLTGASSYREHFHDDFDLPNVNNVGETCVTVTWEQFNTHLLRLTGQARFAEQLERVVLNQLFGAQSCDGSGWGYYVQMEGTKPYSSKLDGHCCLSSGPRGIALIPSFAIATDSDGPVINLFEAGTAKLILADGTRVTLELETRFPADGQVRIRVQPAAEREFSIKLRLPAWSPSTGISVNGQPVASAPGPDGYAAVRRTWKADEVIELRLRLEPRVIPGDHLNQGKAALLYGPLVLAADEALVGQGLPLSSVSLPDLSLSRLGVTPEPAPETRRSWAGAQVFRIHAMARRHSGTLRKGDPFDIRLTPFADAGSQGNPYRVYLPIHGLEPANPLGEGRESRSRQGNVHGSIIDGDPSTFVVTFDGKVAAEDWYAVDLDEPIPVSRVSFVQGKIFHDGGWFDATAGKPKLQAKRTKDSPWETVAEFGDYPATTASAPAGLQPGQTFAASLTQPISAVALRVTGKPASGDNPKQTFSSLAEILAIPPASK